MWRRQQELSGQGEKGGPTVTEGRGSAYDRQKDVYFLYLPYLDLFSGRST